MNGRHMVFTNGLVDKGKIAPVAGEAFADAKRITVPEFVSRILEDRAGGRFLEACARSFDMVVDRIRTVRECYLREAKKALKGGDTGLVFNLQEEWWGSKPEEEGKNPLRSKAERLIADTLFAIYERSNGAMGHQQWRKMADAIKAELFAAIKEPIEETEQEKNAEFYYITVNEKKIVDRIWDAGVNEAERMVLAEEKRVQGSTTPAAS